MGGSLIKNIGDVKPLEKQLEIKQAQIAELEAEFERKDQQNYDEEQKVEEKRRCEFYLEQLIKSKTNELQQLSKTEEQLQAQAAASGLGSQIDDMDVRIVQEEEAMAAIQVDIEKVKQTKKTHEFLSNK